MAAGELRDRRRTRTTEELRKRRSELEREYEAEKARRDGEQNVREQVHDERARTIKRPT